MISSYNIWQKWDFMIPNNTTFVRTQILVKIYKIYIIIMCDNKNVEIN